MSSISSKIFEAALLAKFSDYLLTDSHQFGFKKGTGRSDALFTFRHTIEHFNQHRSNVYTCFLDSTKAFDRVVHSGLISKLFAWKVPLTLLYVLLHWYRDLRCTVKWSDSFSPEFQILAGVRQGGVLSPPLYMVFFFHKQPSLKFWKF